MTSQVTQMTSKTLDLNSLTCNAFATSTLAEQGGVAGSKVIVVFVGKKIG